jgi:Trichohyalin-plectin-homology domain
MVAEYGSKRLILRVDRGTHCVPSGPLSAAACSAVPFPPSSSFFSRFLVSRRVSAEQAAAEERERAARARERETDRLRASQQRAADLRAEIDGIRARRWQEACERDWRRRELEQAEARAAVQRCGRVKGLGFDSEVNAGCRLEARQG